MNSTKNSKNKKGNDNRSLKVLQFQSIWFSIVFIASLWYFTATTMNTDLILPTPMAVLSRMLEIIQGNHFGQLLVAL